MLEDARTPCPLLASLGGDHVSRSARLAVGGFSISTDHPRCSTSSVDLGVAAGRGGDRDQVGLPGRPARRSTPYAVRAVARRRTPRRARGSMSTTPTSSARGSARRTPAAWEWAMPPQPTMPTRRRSGAGRRPARGHRANPLASRRAGPAGRGASPRRCAPAGRRSRCGWRRRAPGPGSSCSSTSEQSTYSVPVPSTTNRWSRAGPAGDVDVLAQLDVALGAQDHQPAVAPGRQALRGVPVDPDVAVGVDRLRSVTSPKSCMAGASGWV